MTDPFDPQEVADLTELIATDPVARQALVVAESTPLAESWLNKPITPQDVSDAVTRFAPSLPPSEFAAFVDWNVERWEGVTWSEAMSWNLSTEWLAFTAERGKE
jgi:hypothetical protein